jgi:hypothetical protein
VLRPPNLGLKASAPEDVQQLIRAADNAPCSIQWGRLGDRSVRFYDIGEHEPSALGQPLRYTRKQVCLQRPVDVMQSKCGSDQLEGPFWQWILEAAKSQLCSRAQNVRRRVQFVLAFVETHSARRRVRLQTSS